MMVHRCLLTILIFKVVLKVFPELLFLGYAVGARVCAAVATLDYFFLASEATSRVVISTCAYNVRVVELRKLLGAKFNESICSWSSTVIQTSTKVFKERSTVRHVYILSIAVLVSSHVVCKRGSLRALLHEQDQVGIIRLLHHVVKMHGVIHLVLGLEYFFKTEVIVAFLQCVKRDLLVVPGED
jgi:hypothetical protein